MTISNGIQLFAAFVAIVFSGSLVVGYSALKLAKERHGTDVRVVWYLFSLASIATWIVALWASGIGAIDNQGEFKGELGATVHAILKFMLDLDTDVKIFTAILAMVLLPQVASYFLSGLFGCASAPIFVGEAIRFFVWGIVKSFVVAAGILLSAALYGYFAEWSAWSIKGAASMCSMSCLLLMLSFAVLYVYRDMHASIEGPTSNRLLRLRRMVDCLRNWLTRHMR